MIREKLFYSAINVAAGLLLVVCFLFSSSNADSLWNKNSSSPYSPEKSYKVGDVIIILIEESSRAQQKAGTNTSTKNDLGVRFAHTIARLNPLLGSNTNVSWSNDNKFTGQGTTQRASSVTAKVAVTVTEVMENGNLKIEGSHTLDVNDESQEIMVSGIVRSKDVSVANTIYSYQVAGAQVSIKGTGVIQEAESPGWFTRIFNWLF